VNKAVRQPINRFSRIIPAVLLLLHLFGTSAIAGDNSADWRPIYDTVMLWVNFLILAFVVYRYGKRPFLTFLKGRQDEVADEIKDLEDRKQEFERQIEETHQMIKDSSTRFENIKSRIKAEGERKRQEIIDHANEQSQKLMEMEKKKAANQIVQARQFLLAELADSATSMALSRLPSEITDTDQDKLLSFYITQLSEYAEQAG
jgi:F-type H+-transporting ATPase subunit b